MKVGDLVRYRGWFNGNPNQLGIIVKVGNPAEEDRDADAFWTKVYAIGKGVRRCSVKSWEVINESR